MVKKKPTWREQFVLWLESKLDRRPKLSEIIQQETEDDELEIAQAEKVIVNHQYLRHMAQARIKAREDWVAQQRQLAGTTES